MDRVLAGSLARRTPKTVTDKAALRAIFAGVRERGYAIEDEESEPGIRCIAAPVRGAGGAVVGAIGIAGPSQRLSLDVLADLSKPLLEVAAAVSVRLGYGTLRGRPMPLIKLAGTDLSWACDDGDTILRSAIRAGLGFPYECNVGSCGNCRFDLVEGEIVTHLRADPPGLNERDRAARPAPRLPGAAATDCTIKARLMPRYVSRFRPSASAGDADRHRATSPTTCASSASGCEAPVRFLPGQYALLSLPGVDGSRAYSMCNTGEDGARMALPDQARAGRRRDRQPVRHGWRSATQIALDGPYGMAYLREDAPRDIVCLAGGSGPVAHDLDRARGCERAGAARHGGSTSSTAGARRATSAARTILEQLPGFGERIHYHPAISETGSDRRRLERLSRLRA